MGRAWDWRCCRSGRGAVEGESSKRSVSRAPGLPRTQPRAREAGSREQSWRGTEGGWTRGGWGSRSVVEALQPVFSPHLPVLPSFGCVQARPESAFLGISVSSVPHVFLGTCHYVQHYLILLVIFFFIFFCHTAWLWGS